MQDDLKNQTLINRDKIADNIRSRLEKETKNFTYTTEHYRPKHEPTAGQEMYVKRIAKALNLQMPEKYTKSAYGKFIAENVESYKKQISEG